MSLEEQRRARFDIWWVEYRGFPSQHDGEAWLAWNAALDSAEIELPDDRSLSASDDPWYVRDLCKDAIESAGLKVKP